MDDNYAPAFERYIGIDYSGARTPDDSLPGLRVYLAQGESPPLEVPPPPSPRKYWSRREIAGWLAVILAEDIPAIAKNAVGAIFLFAGFLMLFLPGQGILTMLIGVSMLDFPGKRKIEAKMIGQRTVLGVINGMRDKFGKPPLVLAPDP